MTKFITRAEIRKKRNRAGLALGLAGLFLMAFLFAYIWQRVYLRQQLADIEYLENRKQELAALGKRLQLEAQSLNSWSQVERLAMENLGMVYPDRSQIQLAVLPPARKELTLVLAAKNLFNPVRPAWSQP
jgi:cell division protein FtsL